MKRKRTTPETDTLRLLRLASREAFKGVDMRTKVSSPNRKAYSRKGRKAWRYVA